LWLPAALPLTTTAWRLTGNPKPLAGSDELDQNRQSDWAVDALLDYQQGIFSEPPKA